MSTLRDVNDFLNLVDKKIKIGKGELLEAHESHSVIKIRIRIDDDFYQLRFFNSVPSLLDTLKQEPVSTCLIVKRATLVILSDSDVSDDDQFSKIELYHRLKSYTKVFA